MNRADEMRAAFTRFAKSGLTLKAFGEREKIPYPTLQYWRRKFRDETSIERLPQKADDSVVLAPVQVIPDVREVDARPERFDVWLANGMSVEVPSGFDEQELRRLVGVLTSC